jgi:hypothetical protein
VKSHKKLAGDQTGNPDSQGPISDQFGRSSGELRLKRSYIFGKSVLTRQFRALALVTRGRILGSSGPENYESIAEISEAAVPRSAIV